MKAINNFDILRPLLIFDGPDDFYQMQIVKRRKENPEIRNNSFVMKEYYITSLEHFDEVREDAKAIAVSTNSRIYLNLNVRSFKTAAFDTMDKLLAHLRSEEYAASSRAYSRSASARTSRKRLNWLIDLDRDENESSQKFMENIDIFFDKLINNKANVLVIAPTPNGVHFIVQPFDRMKFAEMYPDFKLSDIKKNSPTILFSPKF